MDENGIKNTHGTASASSGPVIPAPDSNQDILFKIGRLLSYPHITTPICVILTMIIYFSSLYIFAKPVEVFYVVLSLTIPTLVSFPITVMFRFFTREMEKSNTSLVTANQEIISQREELKDLNKNKLKLFSVIAHDLRSPIAVLKSYLDYFIQEDYDPEFARSTVPKIRKEVHNTIQLIDNLLNWSHTQMHGIKPSFSTFDLSSLLSDNHLAFKSLLADKNISLIIADNNPAVVYADMEMVRLILRNLTANAIKFTPANGQIWIRTEDTSDEVCLIVEDSGVGISKEDQEKLFRKDSYHTTRGTNNEKGTGIGLWLCKKFIEKQNGSLLVESETGKGSRFSFTLPKRNSANDK